MLIISMLGLIVISVLTFAAVRFYEWQVAIIRRKLFDMMYNSNADPEDMATAVYGQSSIKVISTYYRMRRIPRGQNMAVLCLFGGFNIIKP